MARWARSLRTEPEAHTVARAADLSLQSRITMPKEARDIERTYTARQFVSKLRRLADAIEEGRRFRIQVGGERISVPPDATISVEHERSETEEEVEFQIRWRNG